MKNNNLRFLFFVIALSAAGLFPAGAQSRGNAAYGGGSHRGTVTVLLRDENARIISAGEDGFLGIWSEREAEDRFQVSRYAIKFMAVRPGKNEAAVVENIGFSLNIISVWNYATKKKLFTVYFRDSISAINYSAAGSFLIVSASGPGKTAFLDSETGETLDSPELPDFITLASTGRSERTMVCYQTSGALSYWNLETGSEMQRFNVPSNIREAVLLGNNRFMAGFDSQGLLILDAVTGAVFAREQSIRQGIIIADAADPAQFNCFSPSGGGAVIYRMEIGLSGSLRTINRRNVSIDGGVISGVSVGGGNVILGSDRGDLWLLDRGGEALIKRENKEHILDFAVSSSNIALISDSGNLVFLPLDYSMLKSGDSLAPEKLNGSPDLYSVTADPSDGEGRFLLWQGGRSAPVIVSPEGTQNPLDRFSTRAPLHSAAMLEGSILFLNTAGTVSVHDRESGAARFSYTAAGAVDAAFIDRQTIIIGRNSLAGNSPFMTVNISTGETVSFAYPALLGMKTYRGGSGAVYGTVMNQAAGDIKTSILKLDMQNHARTEKIAEYNGEDPFIIMAESGGNFAAALGDGTATLYPNSQSGQTGQRAVSFERGAGFPVKILNGGRWFVVLDGEGCISWHDNQTGALLAHFRLYPESWVLEKTVPSRAGKETTAGSLANARL